MLHNGLLPRPDARPYRGSDHDDAAAAGAVGGVDGALGGDPGGGGGAGSLWFPQELPSTPRAACPA